jgi:hypothetical protein
MNLKHFANRFQQRFAVPERGGRHWHSSVSHWSWQRCGCALAGASN